MYKVTFELSFTDTFLQLYKRHEIFTTYLSKQFSRYTSYSAVNASKRT